MIGKIIRAIGQIVVAAAILVGILYLVGHVDDNVKNDQVKCESSGGQWLPVQAGPASSNSPGIDMVCKYPDKPSAEQTPKAP